VATGRIGVTPTLRTRWSDQPTVGTTSLSGLDDNSVSLVYDVGYEAVYRNGVLLSRGNDYTATDGTTVTLIDATLAGDIIEIFANELVPLTDAISKGQYNAKGALLSATAASTPGVLAVGANDTVLTADSSEATGLKWAAASGPTVSSYTPTLTNLTLGNGTLTAKYSQTGKIVTVYFNFTLGSTSSVGSNPSMTLPVSAADIYNTAKLFLADYGTVTYWGSAWNGDATTVYLEADRADDTYLKAAGVTATVPHTWAVNDSIVFTLTYLAV
jgi:hypothetical protein